MAGKLLSRGDNIMIIRGKGKSETGTIKPVIRRQNRVFVEGKNLVKMHIKGGEGHEGGIFTVEAPMKPWNQISGRLEDGTNVRLARGIEAYGSLIPRPKILKIKTTPRPTVVT